MRERLIRDEDENEIREENPLKIKGKVLAVAGKFAVAGKKKD
jgi:hypothetical protein